MNSIENASLLEERDLVSLSNYNFFIPSYQRGYRWTDKEVEDLLDDIDRFRPEKINGTERESWYCLQPVVLKECSNETRRKNDLTGTWYEVIDGQQRLTSIFLLMHYANEMWIGKQKDKEFTIRYETREESEHFLESLKVNDSNEVDIDSSTVDFYFMSKAYSVINEWTKNYEKRNGKHLNFNSILSKLRENVKVIWYEVKDNSDPIDIFTRLNMGKIPLTNAELIKALFLGKANPNNQNQRPNSKQLQIATEWDSIERTLQDDSFWYFIYDNNNQELPQQNYETRIEYIFDLMKGRKEGEEKYYTFYKFILDDFEKNKTSNGESDIASIWLEVKKYFLTLEEWYNDRELYHLIGFLITTETSLIKIKSKSDSMLKSDFKRYLKSEVREKFKLELQDLDYGESKHHKEIHRVLLLHNIITLLANDHSKSRFPFDSYKKDQWDIEHVHSQTDNELNTSLERSKWAGMVLEFYLGVAPGHSGFTAAFDNPENKVDRGILEGLMNIYNEEYAESEFSDIFKRISKKFGEGEQATHGIGNLALLDAGTNRAYKNAFFPIKRMKIMKREKNGSFVPICTKNVFMKAYSKRLDKILNWKRADAEDYYLDIKTTLENYFNLTLEDHA